MHPSGSSVLAVPIRAGADDAEEREGGSVSRSSSDLELVTDAAPQVVGLRFSGVAVPPGATINDAYVQFTTATATVASTSLQVRLQLSPDAAPISGHAFNLSSRLAGSTGPVAWDPAPWTTVRAAKLEQRTPSLAAGLQQVVAQADWNAGNAVVVLVTGSGRRTAFSYDGDASAAAVLHVSYTLP